MEVANYEDFPELVVQVLDQWGQACSFTDRRLRLCAECDVFAKGLQFASVEQGQGVFAPIKIKAVSGSVPCSAAVKISLVVVEVNRRKTSVSETVRQLSKFSISVLPSSLPHKISVLGANQSGRQNGRCQEGKERLELVAKAGSILKGLRLDAFDEADKPIAAEELINMQPKVTTSWSGEVSTRLYTLTCPWPIWSKFNYTVELSLHFSPNQARPKAVREPGASGGRPKAERSLAARRGVTLSFSFIPHGLRPGSIWREKERQFHSLKFNPLHFIHT